MAAVRVMPTGLSQRNSVRDSAGDSRTRMSAHLRRTLDPAWVDSRSIITIKISINVKSSLLVVVKVMATDSALSLNVRKSVWQEKSQRLNLSQPSLNRQFVSFLLTLDWQPAMIS